MGIRHYIGFSAIFFCGGLLAASWTYPGSGHSLKAILARAQPGDTIHIEGVVKEGTITIDRPVVLIGNAHAVIDGEEAGEVVVVRSHDVTLRGLLIRGTRKSDLNDNAGIKVIGSDRAKIIGNTLQHCFFAIYLSGSKDALVQGNTVIGDALHEDRMANGIHLWKCSGVVITDNRVENHRDGIYFEFVTDSRISGNSARKCLRYGLHFMFSHRNEYEGNLFEENGAGVAVMYSKEIVMQHNRFLRNTGASAYGLLLKEINDGIIRSNIFADNTTGIMLDGCNRIAVEQNELRSNGYALRLFANAMNCRFNNNAFMGNTFDLSTNGTLMDNIMDGNYWDRYSGYDLDRDGHGDVPHRPLGFFTLLVEQQPYAMVFSRSLFVSLLDRAERLIPSLSPSSLKDDRPLMVPPERSSARKGKDKNG